ncbi:hypothetical protein ACTFIY_000969 [Dictyostelium cf. discoideum]
MSKRQFQFLLSFLILIFLKFINQIRCDESNGVIIIKNIQDGVVQSYCQMEQIRDEYITIKTNYGIVSSIGSTTASGSVDGKKEFSLIFNQLIPSDIGYEYFFLRWGTNKQTIATLTDPFLNPYRFNIIHLNRTDLYSIQSTINNSYLVENLNLISKQVTFNSLIFINRKSPFFFIFSNFNKVCDNKNNFNMEILYPNVVDNDDFKFNNSNNNNVDNSSFCSSIQYGNQLVTIKSMSSGNYISSEGSTNAWDIGNKFIKTIPLSSELTDSNYFKIITFENNKIGFLDKFKSFWSWNDTNVEVSSTMLKNQKFNLEPVLNNPSCSKNCYYIKTGNGGYIKEYITKNSVNGNLLNSGGSGDKTMFLIKLLPICSKDINNYGTSSSTSTTSSSSSSSTTTTSSKITTTSNINDSFDDENLINSSSTIKFSIPTMIIIITIIILNILIVIKF